MEKTLVNDYITQLQAEIDFLNESIESKQLSLQEEQALLNDLLQQQDKLINKLSDPLDKHMGLDDEILVVSP